MNFCGIICEFNPLHNGHEYIIKKAKEITNENVVCLMSGDFVQRGEAATESKFERAKKALDVGADAVLELPTIFACSPAETFAFGAIKILDSLGATHVAFGVEKTDIETLMTVAKLKAENSKKFKNSFKNEIQNGVNFNTALKRAIAKNLQDESIFETLNKPNNVLAIEYLTAIIKLKSNIIPVAIERCDEGFVSNKPCGKFLSASAIRDKLENGENVLDFVPENAKIERFFDKSHQKMLQTLQILQIRKLSPEKLGKFFDYSEGIEYRVKKTAETHREYDEILENICSPRYRKPRVQKLLLYPLLGISKSDFRIATKTKPAVKILAIKKTFKNFLSETDREKISIIAKNFDYENLSKQQQKVVEIDLNASLIYETIISGTANADKKIGTIFL